MTQLTAEQLAAGWLPHDGGPCPVPLVSRPGVVFDDGDITATGSVEAREWSTEGGDWWQHRGTRYGENIIGYLPDPNYVAENATGVVDDRQQLEGSLQCKVDSYNDMHEQAVDLGYPSILEALEDLERLRATPDPLSALLAPDEALVEAAARALCAEEQGGPLGYFPDGSPMRNGGVWEEYDDACHDGWRSSARAALIAAGQELARRKENEG